MKPFLSKYENLKKTSDIKIHANSLTCSGSPATDNQLTDQRPGRHFSKKEFCCFRNVKKTRGQYFVQFTRISVNARDWYM